MTAMTMSRFAKRLRHAAWGGVLGLAVLAACLPGSARAEDDDSSENPIAKLERKVWTGFVNALGLRSGDEPQIDYRERSPLVVPPTRDLPPPETTGSVAAKQNPAWPSDPDVKRKKEAAKRKKTETRIYDTDRAGQPLTPSELNPQSAPSRRSGGRPVDPASVDGEPGNPVKPSQLGYFGGLFSFKGFGFGVTEKDEVGTFTREPPRTTLTAPPTGYQTPSGAQPYGVTKDSKLDAPATPRADPAVGSGY